MKVLLAHPGTQHAFRLAAELERRGLLGEFHTGLAWAADGAAGRLVARCGGPASRLVRGVPGARLHPHPWNELRALWRLRRGGESEPVLHERNRRFQEAIPAAALDRHDAVIAFDTSAWLLAQRAEQRHRPLYLDRTIAHPARWQQLVRSLAGRYPGWFGDLRPRPDYLTAAEAEEHARAQRIVVGGAFARDTLVEQGVPAGKVVVNPYGVDWERFASHPAPAGRGHRPFRFLFLGSLLARKGVPVLLDAWRALGPARGDAELWLVGPCGARERGLIPALPGLVVRDRVPHAQVPALLAECDVFVLPSLLEGFGLVLLEALASGLPLISTPNTGLVDMLLDASLGTMVPAGETEPLAAALAAALARPPDRAAVRRAAAPLQAKFSWSAYGDRWADLLRPPA